MTFPKKTLFVLSIVLFLAVIGFYIHEQAHSKETIIGDGTSGPEGMNWLPGGTFMMGSQSRLAKPNEKPAHKVHVDGFWIDRTHVTNAQFAAFVEATGYVTTAERPIDWEIFKHQLPPGTPKPTQDLLVPGAMVFVGTDHAVQPGDFSKWWHFVPGAHWRQPQGPGSSIVGKEDHPVVQVSYEDALAYAQWIDKRLPTEAEWEYAARGGLEQADYTWGGEFRPEGKRMANTFSGEAFPVVDRVYKNRIGTSAVGAYPANGYGLYDMAGNAWQWVADWYRADAFVLASTESLLMNPSGPVDSYDPADHTAPVNAPKRVVRGGSFLCDENFCMSYRPSARRGSDPYNATSNIGFRLVLPAKLARPEG